MLQIIEKTYKDGELVFFQSLLGCFNIVASIKREKELETFNPFWDASAVKGHNVKVNLNNFQSLLGCFQ